MSKTRKSIQNDNGFTLVELMVTVFLTAIAVISIYRGYTAFSQATDAQQQVMEMQQNLRIGMTRLAADIRRAGMNEEGETDAGFLCETFPTNAKTMEFSMDLIGFTTPAPGVSFRFDSVDNDDDGETDEEDEGRIGDGDTLDDGEKIIYFLDSDEDTNDNGKLDPGEDLNGNKVLDQWLQRSVWKAGAYVTQTLITNVEALDFVYFDDEGTRLDSFTLDCVPGLGLGLELDDLEIVDRVEITLVVRATNEDFRYTNKETYGNLQGEELWPLTNPSDNFRRRAASMIVQIRNNI